MDKDKLEQLAVQCLEEIKKDPTLVWNDRLNTSKAIINWTVTYLVDKYKLYI